MKQQAKKVSVHKLSTQHQQTHIHMCIDFHSKPYFIETTYFTKKHFMAAYAPAQIIFYLLVATYSVQCTSALTNGTLTTIGHLQCTSALTNGTFPTVYSVLVYQLLVLLHTKSHLHVPTTSLKLDTLVAISMQLSQLKTISLKHTVYMLTLYSTSGYRTTHLNLVTFLHHYILQSSLVHQP